MSRGIIPLHSDPIREAARIDDEVAGDFHITITMSEPDGLPRKIRLEGDEAACGILYRLAQRNALTAASRRVE